MWKCTSQMLIIVSLDHQCSVSMYFWYYSLSVFRVEFIWLDCYILCCFRIWKLYLLYSPSMFRTYDLVLHLVLTRGWSILWAIAYWLKLEVIWLEVTLLINKWLEVRLLLHYHLMLVEQLCLCMAVVLIIGNLKLVSHHQIDAYFP